MNTPIINFATFTSVRSVVRQTLVCNTRVVLVAAVTAAALALPEATVASAGAWVGINRDFGKALLYLDKASITREGNTDKAWLMALAIDGARISCAWCTFAGPRSSRAHAFFAEYVCLASGAGQTDWRLR